MVLLFFLAGFSDDFFCFFAAKAAGHLSGASRDSGNFKLRQYPILRLQAIAALAAHLSRTHPMSGFTSWFRVAGQLGAIAAAQQQLLLGQARIMASLSDILAKVQAEKTVEDSAVALMQTLSQQLKDAIANNDTATMQQIADMLDTDNSALAAAVTANTPAAAAAGSSGTTNTTAQPGA